jgi:CBS-domain-containing membrane protein
MVKRAFRVSLKTALHVALLGLLVWIAGRPFIFPSLGPTAFALALHPQQNTARQVLGGHLCGVLAGLLVYHTFAAGLIVTTVHAPFSTGSLWLAASGAVSVALTAASMLLTRTVHAPACATTLIISLGLLPSFAEGGIIMVAVALLYSVHCLLQWAASRRSHPRTV